MWYKRLPSMIRREPLFTIREWEFGRPQLFASLLLLAFLLETFWIAHRKPLSTDELAYLQAGLNQFQGKLVWNAGPSTPVAAAAAATPILLLYRSPDSLHPEMLKWLVRLPFIGFGWLLGASIWYVARRLYGNAGGYIALALYCFSPMTLLSARAGPLITASLGMFGVIFVSIALSHTLYAPPRQPDADHPRRALLELKHRWRRVVLLGLGIVLAAGSSYATVSIAFLALGFMLYLAPEHRLGSLGLMLSGFLVALLVIFALYGFRLHGLAYALSTSHFLPDIQRRLPDAGHWRGLLQTINPSVLLLMLVSLATYIASRRSRYFGNTAPLLVVVLLVALGLASFSPVFFFGPFPAHAVAFLFVFIGGVFADLLETPWRAHVLLVFLVLLVTYALSFLLVLVRMRV